MDHTEAEAFAICAFRTYTSVFHPSLIFIAFMTHSMSFKSHASNIRQKRQRSPFALSANGTRPQPPTSLYVRSGSVRHLRFPQMVLDPSPPPLYTSEAAAFAICAFRTHTNTFQSSLNSMAFMIQSMSFVTRELYTDIRQKERWGAGVETQKNVREEIGDGVEYHLMSPTPRC